MSAKLERGGVVAFKIASIEQTISNSNVANISGSIRSAQKIHLRSLSATMSFSVSSRCSDFKKSHALQELAKALLFPSFYS